MLHLNYPPCPSLCSFTSIDIMIPNNRQQILLVGKAKTRQSISYSIIGIRTLPYQPLKQLIYCSQHGLNSEELESALEKEEVSKKTSKVIRTQGLIGFIKFIQGYYLMYIQQAEPIARIGKHKVKIIKKTNILPLFQLVNNETKAHEKRYLELLRSYKLENYYFSTTYDLTNSLFWNLHNYKQQEGSPNSATQPMFSQDKSMHGICQIFQWNYNLMKEFNEEVSVRNWVVPIIHGFCRQINVKTRGTLFAVIIVSRRSRHHAGTRYIKRGINQHGFVANFVQTEQIVINCSSNFKFPNCSSFIQVRGSAPVYWMQQPNFVNPKPAIELVGSDPMFLATKKHFSDLISHYGRHIFCINLMKTIENNPRQIILSAEYNRAITLINQEFESIKDPNRIHYMETDYKANQKINKTVFMDKIKSLGYYCVLKTGISQCRSISSAKKQEIQLQNGVIRANCVDCLDRTNSFQQIMGEVALAIQIAKLINQQIDENTLTSDMSIYENYGQIFEEMGDLISIQYGSSLAHKQQISKTEATRFEFMTSMTRHINNTFNDNERQQQIDLFLKIQIPEDTLIWDLKPHITLFPTHAIREKITKYWERRAYNRFKKQADLEFYQKLNKEVITNNKIVNKITRNIEKHDLVVIWSNDIADEMYADLEEQYLFWIQIPPLKQIKPLRKLKTKLSIRKNLEQKLNQSYDKYQRKLTSKISQSPEMVEPELTVTITQPSQYFNSIIHNESSHLELNLNTKNSLKASDEIYEITVTHPEFNRFETANSIESYLNSDVIDNEVISSDLALICQALFDPTVEISSEEKVSEEEMALIAQKINSMDFISQNKIPSDTGANSPNERRDRRRTFFIPARDITIDDKKTQVLEQLITKHFTHGHKVGRIRII